MFFPKIQKIFEKKFNKKNQKKFQKKKFKKKKSKKISKKKNSKKKSKKFSKEKLLTQLTNPSSFGTVIQKSDSISIIEQVLQIEEVLVVNE